MTPEEADAWFATRVILTPKRHMGFVVTWALLGVLYVGLLILNWYISDLALWWYYGGMAAGTTFLAYRNYQGYRIAKIRRDSAVPQWFKDMCLSYWVWAREERSTVRRQKLAGIRKGIGLDRRR